MYEIVRVVEPLFLVNSRRHACRYRTGNDRPLSPGYYLALWSTPQGDERDYGRGVAYVGPLPSRREAEVLQESAVALGLVAPDAAPARPGRAGRAPAPLLALSRTPLQGGCRHVPA